MVYKWSSYNFSVDAQKVGETLEKLEEKNGNFSAEDMVNEARKKQSVLHPLFEWDDKKAAEAYRVTQAHTILHCLTVTDAGTKEPVRAFMNVTIKGVANKGSFVSVQSAMTDALSRECILKNAILELSAFQRKYSKLQELKNVFEAIDALKQ